MQRKTEWSGSYKSNNCGRKEETVFQKENLTEQIIYYPSDSKNILGKIKSINRYYKISKLAIQQYIKKNGLPDYVHVHVPIRAGAVALWMKEKYGINYALTEHYGIYNSVAEDHIGTRSIFFRRALKKIIKKTFRINKNGMIISYYNNENLIRMLNQNKRIRKASY